LASCVSFSEYEKEFKKIWLTKEVNTAGLFALEAYVRGIKSIIVVDDYIPFINDSPIFAKIGYDGAIWGPIIEKMWAKLHGNYEATIGGIESEALKFLTGAPSF
jgi:calpain